MKRATSHNVEKGSIPSLGFLVISVVINADEILSEVFLRLELNPAGARRWQEETSLL